MKEFDDLVKVVDHLLSPEGCPWDREQTMKSIRPDVLEEVCELIEAIDLEDNDHIREELGDLFFIVIFLSRLAEKENRSYMADALNDITEKLIRRHPHVFGEEQIQTVSDLYKRWDEIKKTEKGKDQRTSELDGIPKGMPALARAQKVLKKASKAGYKDFPVAKEVTFADEESLGQLLLGIVKQAQEKNLNAEQALRGSLAHLEQHFKQFEQDKREAIS